MLLLLRGALCYRCGSLFAVCCLSLAVVRNWLSCVVCCVLVGDVCCFVAVRCALRLLMRILKCFLLCVGRCVLLVGGLFVVRSVLFAVWRWLLCAVSFCDVCCCVLFGVRLCGMSLLLLGFVGRCWLVSGVARCCSLSVASCLLCVVEC